MPEIGGYVTEKNDNFSELNGDGDFFKKLIERSRDGMAVIDQNGVISFINPAGQNLLGFQNNSLLGKNLIDIIHPDDIETATEFIKRIDDYNCRGLRLVGKASASVFVEIAPSVLERKGSKSSYILNIRDVSKRKAKEQKEKKVNTKQLKLAELLQKLTKNAPDIISLWDSVNGIPLYYNRKTIFGYELNLVNPKIVSGELYHPDDRKKMLELGKNLMTIPYFNPRVLEFRAMTKGGHYEWVRNKVVVIERDQQGLPTLMVSWASIITAAKKSIEELEDSKARMLAILENTKERIWSLDKDLRITATNSAFNKVYQRQSMVKPEVGLSIFECGIEEEKQKWQKFYDKALGGEAFSETVKSMENGKTIFLEVSFYPIIDCKGNVEGISCFAKDITQRKLFEDELKQSNFELDSFVYRSSHDMMAPLKSILGLVNILRLELSEEEKDKYLNLVEKSVKKLDNFISELTTFSRNSRLPVLAVPVDFREIIQNALEVLAYMENAGRLAVNLNLDLREEFYCDLSRLQIIFQNFISNSIKYQRLNIDYPKIDISIKADKKSAIITFEDNGKGIKEEYISKIFEMFFRASDESYGSGLGLYITKQAIDRLGGKILNVNSVYGEGTSFVIEIPNRQPS